ncbi:MULTISPECIES: NAD(+)/NADH kinase [Plantibacter]|uniref:NAD(+)/NADH kinase n=1 Tax=Plantibacter TaxID=190323 RepID=UPI001E5858D9|nr:MULTISPECIES: NAD(+)/NADH kinase [unclassified Plantibacter]
MTTTRTKHPTGPSMTIGLITHPTKNIDDSVRILRSWQLEHGARLVGLRAEANRLGDDVELLDEDAFASSVDVAVAMGGDGTMLGAMRLLAGRSAPVLGVNYGNVGFLVEVEPAALAEALQRVSDNEFSLEPHHGLEVTITTGEQVAHLLAFNDVSIARRPGTGVVMADLAVDGTAYGYFKADAIVIATPTGSTAYNYAAGGPVLSPAVAATVVTPVAPMSGIDRSFILGPAERLQFSIGTATKQAAVEIDGQVLSDVASGAVVTVRLVRDAANVVRLDPSRHSRKGRMKLSLLDLPLRRDQLLDLVPPDIRARVERPSRVRRTRSKPADPSH